MSCGSLSSLMNSNRAPANTRRLLTSNTAADTRSRRRPVDVIVIVAVSSGRGGPAGTTGGAGDGAGTGGAGAESLPHAIEDASSAAVDNRTEILMTPNF